ncbi:SHOCT domain-containing protein [Nocardia sp. NPDC057668]|uniref:SHOCT domain-containing protein n=1 Tax=Nocardia sp. NPDC057668 TaxID=3346202 RepID=UPI00366ACAAD
MGIVRNVAIRVLAPYEQAYPAIEHGMKALGVEITRRGNPLLAESKRSLRKNRWAATLSAGFRPESPSSTVIEWTVDMMGSKHIELIDDITAAGGLPIDDHGLTAALDRIGKLGWLFGHREARSLSEYIRLDEYVIELAQGLFDDQRQGMLVLTTRRMFFFDKGLLSASVEEFALDAVVALGFSTQPGGETVTISTSRWMASVAQIAHGRGEAFVAAFRRLKAEAGGGGAQRAPVGDIAENLRKLGELRDAGLLTEGEFAAKKAELLARM